MGKRRVNLLLKEEAVKNLRLVALNMGICTTAGNGSLSGVMNVMGGDPETAREAVLMIVTKDAERRAADYRKALEDCKDGET